MIKDNETVDAMQGPLCQLHAKFPRRRAALAVGPFQGKTLTTTLPVHAVRDQRHAPCAPRHLKARRRCFAHLAPRRPSDQAQREILPRRHAPDLLGAVAHHSLSSGADRSTARRPKQRPRPRAARLADVDTGALCAASPTNSERSPAPCSKAKLWAGCAIAAISPR
jgi:hypothetical protein